WMRRAEVGKAVVVHTHPAAEPPVDVVALTQPRQRPRAANALTRRIEPQRQQKSRARRRLSSRMGSRSDRLFKLAQIKLLDVSPDYPDRMLGGHQRLQIHRAKLDLTADRFPHPRFARISHPHVLLDREIGKRFVARHRCTSPTAQQKESFYPCKLNQIR